MFWDIAISVLAAICQLLTVWLGLRITMNPIDPKDPKLRKKRILYEGSFVLVGVLGVIFVGLAAYRAPRERAHLSIVPSVTYEELGKKPSWLDGAPFLQINKPLAFNIVYQNVGSGSALNTLTRGHVFIEPNLSATSEDDVLAQFERLSTLEPLKGGFTVPKGIIGWGTVKGPILSPEDYNNLVSGRRVVYVVEEVVWSDDSGKHHRHFCSGLQPLQEGGDLIWQHCDRYGEEQ